MLEWEYLFTSSRAGYSITDQLNGLGALGWELVMVVQPNRPTCRDFYFKRPKLVAVPLRERPVL